MDNIDDELAVLNGMARAKAKRHALELLKLELNIQNRKQLSKKTQIQCSLYK